jgi:H+/Cl- antiporter ClcA
VPRATLTIWLWCTTLAAAALGTRFFPVHEHGSWHLWAIVAAAALGVLALAASVYVVYLLEIVKLANPRVRRRTAEPPPAEPRERRSA